MKRLLLVPAVLALPLVAACGDDSEKGSERTTTTEATTTSSQETTTTAGGDPSGEVAVTVTASGPIDLQVGERARIELTANETTGFTWAPLFDPDGAVVEIVSDSYEPEPGAEDRAGAGGTQIYVIEAVGAGSTTLELGYSQPWEESAPPAETATFEITVS